MNPVIVVLNAIAYLDRAYNAALLMVDDDQREKTLSGLEGAARALDEVLDLHNVEHVNGMSLFWIEDEPLFLI